MVLVTASVVLAIAVPVLERAADTADAAAAARYVASVVARARFDAARHQRARAVRFVARCRRRRSRWSPTATATA